jgi:hypothetical protein
MIWAAISWYSVGPIITLNSRITATDYVDIFRNQTHPIVQMFPTSDAIFQVISSPIHTVRSMQSWFEHEDTLLHLPWPAQSPDLNIVQPLLLRVTSLVV